jgi:hypothetical protein
MLRDGDGQGNRGLQPQYARVGAERQGRMTGVSCPVARAVGFCGDLGGERKMGYWHGQESEPRWATGVAEGCLISGWGRNGREKMLAERGPTTLRLEKGRREDLLVTTLRS